jgi:prepilin-type N-terminal cleavage/methylation domain-containing protein
MHTYIQHPWCKPVVNRKSARLQAENGFTLTELLVTVAIALVLLAGIGWMIVSGVRSSSAAYSLVQMETAAGEVLSTITRQIRVAAHVDPDSDVSRLTFSGDLSGDDVQRTQSFYVENGALVRDGQPWVENVSSVTFTYYSYNRETKQEEILLPGSFPGWNEQIHRVDIRIEISRSAAGTNLSRTYRGSVTIMNALR